MQARPENSHPSAPISEARSFGRPLTLVTFLSTLAFASTILAFTDPTQSGPNPEDPAGFLDVAGEAPNATAYCASPNYFGFWTFGSDADGAVAGTATTGPGGVDMTLTDRAGVGGGLRLTLPDHGVIFDENDDGTATLSQPMFYSQWVFVDLDLNSEGFEVTGCVGGDDLCVGGTPSAGVAVMAQNTSFTGGSISTNQATGTASYNVGPGSSQSPVNLSSRMQIDFLGGVDTVVLNKIGSGGAGFAVGGGCDPLGISKEAGTPIALANGSFVIPYTLRVLNNLPDAATIASVLAAAEAASLPGQFAGPPAPAEIPIASFQVTDDLAAAFGSGTFTVANLETGSLTPNPLFDGDVDTRLLAGTDILAPGASETLTFEVTFTPPVDAIYPLDLINQATASGTAQSVPVEDLSDDGSNPGPANDNGSGGTGDPTPIVIDGPAPGPVTEVPTLSEWSALALMLALLGCGWLAIRRVG